MFDRIELGQPGDFHVHLRDGQMKELVTPLVREGGVSVCYVMPNLVPPLTDPAKVIEYRTSLEKLAPRTVFLMSLYLSPEVTPEVIRKAREMGITGVKCYPAGVTTNSDKGVQSYEPFYPTFAEMERQGMILNLHGECPSTDEGIHVMNAEEKFLPTLEGLHAKFPKLRIILEHCTSAAAIETVKRCGDTVAATITAHHLYLTVDSWGGNAHFFCKPVAKLPSDRQALIEAATSGNPKFFFGSDSAPHPIENKTKVPSAAGVFTQACALAYVAEVFDKAGKLENLRGFVSDFGKQFYAISPNRLDPATVSVVRTPATVPKQYTNLDVTVVPFRAGETLPWSVQWSS